MSKRYKVGASSASQRANDDSHKKSAMAQLSLEGIGEEQQSETFLCVCGSALSQVAGKSDSLLCLACARSWIIAGREEWR